MKRKILLATGLCLLISSSLYSQTDAQRKQIIKDYDQVASARLSAQVIADDKVEMARLSILKEQNNWPDQIILEDGRTADLVGVNNYDQPKYVTTMNAEAAQMQGADALYNGGALGVNIEGQNMTVGVWDGNKVRDTHNAFSGRASFGELLFANDSHATHVAGTIISNGAGNMASRGIAPQASVVYYRFRQSGHPGADETEMIAEASNGLLVSNHSYGIPATSVNTAFLGKYDSDSREWDNIAFTFPNYLIVSSAGNSQGDGANFLDNDYDLLTSQSNAKNVVTVGASVGQPNYNGPGSVSMSNFSSWGPTDDGRVKPDITTKGVAMFSTDSFSDTAFFTRQGTSMSSPAVAGGAILLQQYYNSLNNSFMRAASLKGLMFHTVFEAGTDDGPDYRFGWGLLNTRRAAEVIRDNGSTAQLAELSLANNATFTTSYTSNSGPLVISISWTDPEATTLASAANDDPLPMIVNDLDIVVTDASGTSFFPWKLDPGNFTAAATRGVNDVDIFEKIEIDAPAGTYNVTVSHKGTLRNGSQDFTLIASGVDNGTLSNSRDELEQFSIYPNPATDYFNISFNNELSGEDTSVQIYDVLGKLVMNNTYENTGRFEQRISTASLDSGIYLVRVGNSVTSSTKKLVIK